MNYPRLVYAIQHNVTGRIYIGSSSDIVRRYNTHMCKLRKGNHSNKLMQYDFSKYGDDYSLFKIDTIENGLERLKEFEWMIKLNTKDDGFGYNGCDRGLISMSNDSIPFKEGFPDVRETPFKD